MQPLPVSASEKSACSMPCERCPLHREKDRKKKCCKKFKEGKRCKKCPRR